MVEMGRNPPSLPLMGRIVTKSDDRALVYGTSGSHRSSDGQGSGQR